MRQPRPGLTIFFCLTALVAAWLGPPPAEAQTVGGMEKATLNVVANRTVHAPGETARVAAVMTIEEGWHTNSHEPTFEWLIPTEITVRPPAGWPPVSSVDYPRGEMKSFAFAEQPLSVFEGEVSIVAAVPVPREARPGGYPVAVELTYQACDDRSCLPPVTASAELTLAVAEEGSATLQPGFPVDQPEGERGQGPSLLLILLLGVAGGLILNAMPCVLPVLSLKVFGLVKAAGQGRGQVVAGALATAAGILLSFWALALAAILARSAGAAVGWGVQFQEPVFVTFLTVVVVLFTLNLWGLFEIRLPGLLARVAGSGPGEGIAGHLASGLFATLMATPCSAPFLGTAVGFALSQPAGMIFVVFTAIAVGMALPYLLLAAAPATARLLPRPGDWMVTLKVVMGFLLAGAAVWLLYVLAAQVSPERLAFIQLALLAMALFFWLLQGARKRAVRAGLVVAILVSILAAFFLADRAEGPGDLLARSRSPHLIEWTPFDREEAERLGAAGTLVFVDVTADWCFTCKVNERLVLETPEVAEAFRHHGVVAMKADWTNRSDAIAEFLADHGRYGIPFYLLYRPGAEPHLLGELLTKEGVLRVLDEADG